MSLSYSWNAPNSTSAGALPQTPLGDLTALPQTPYLDLRGILLKGKTGRQGKKRDKGRAREGRGGQHSPARPLA